VTTWKSPLLQDAAMILGGNAIVEDGREHIRELNVEQNFLKARAGGSPTRAAIDDRTGLWGAG
jgi:hypothetical protein